jgi:thiazole synthase
MSDPLIIAGREFGSRLFLGTAGYPNRKLMLDAIAASGTEMVTASIRRISLAGEDESLVRNTCIFCPTPRAAKPRRMRCSLPSSRARR